MILKCLLVLIFTDQAVNEQDRRVITTLKYSRHYMKPAIVNGKPVAVGEIPYVVSIKQLIRSKDKEYIWGNLCGGSIISKSTVLTAAHCFEGNNFYHARHPQSLFVVAGNLRNDVTYKPNDTTTQWRKIKNLILHRNFHFPNHDIALFTVKRHWNFGNNVNYVVTARKNMDYPRTCMSAGFGRLGHDARAAKAQRLLLAPIHILPRSQCSKIWEMDMNTFICSNSLVSDVAVGDSGGPLVCKWTFDPAEQVDHDLLVGVVSGKNFDYTTIFTRVSAYHDWIARLDRDATATGNVCNLKGNSFSLLIIVFIFKYLSFFSSFG